MSFNNISTGAVIAYFICIGYVKKLNKTGSNAQFIRCPLKNKQSKIPKLLIFSSVNPALLLIFLVENLLTSLTGFSMTTCT